MNKTDHEFNIMFGARLQIARENAKKSQSEVAKYLKVSKNHLSDIERGLHKCSAQMFLDYCECLDITPNELCGLKGPVWINEDLYNIILRLDQQQQRKLIRILDIIDL